MKKYLFLVVTVCLLIIGVCLGIVIHIFTKNHKTHPPDLS